MQRAKEAFSFPCRFDDSCLLLLDALLIKSILNVTKTRLWCNELFTVKTRQDPSRPVKTRQDPSRPVKTCQDLSRPVKTCQNLSRPVKTCQDPSRPVKTCQDLSRPVKTCQDLSSTSRFFFLDSPNHSQSLNLHPNW